MPIVETLNTVLDPLQIIEVAVGCTVILEGVFTIIVALTEVALPQAPETTTLYVPVLAT